MAKAFQPRFKGNYRVVLQRSNQVEIWPAESGETTKFHVTDIKKVIPVNQAIAQLPDYNRLGHLTKLRLNPTNIPDLDWQLALELNTTPILYRTTKTDEQTMPTVQAVSMVVTKVIAKTAKLKIN